MNKVKIFVSYSENVSINLLVIYEKKHWNLVSESTLSVKHAQ